MLRDVKPENIQLENKDGKSNVSNQCDQESQDNKETKEAIVLPSSFQIKKRKLII